MTPFSTTAITEHLFTHISQVVGISTRLRVSSFFFRSGSKWRTEAAAATPAAPLAVHVRNLLRSMASPRRCDFFDVGRLFAASFGLQRIGGVCVQESGDIAQLIVGHELGQDFFTFSMLPGGEIHPPLRLGLVQRRYLAAHRAFGMAAFASSTEVVAPLALTSFNARRHRCNRRNGCHKYCRQGTEYE